MDRQTAGALAVAALGIVAVALAAATLTAPVETAGGGGGATNGTGGGGLFPPPDPDPAPTLPLRISVPTVLLRALVPIVGLLAALYVVLHVREALRLFAATVVTVLVLAVFVWGLTLLLGSGGPPGFAAGPGVLGGGSDGSAAAGSSPSVPPMLLLVGLGAALVGAAIALRAGGEADSPADPTEHTRSPAAAAVGATAGRTADRIESEASADNEIYRAWREMTRHLDVADPETTAPGEFAAAAVEAGLDPADVAELTRLFEDVRYGGRPPSDDDEERAVAVLRRIETTYSREGEPQ